MAPNKATRTYLIHKKGIYLCLLNAVHLKSAQDPVEHKIRASYFWSEFFLTGSDLKTKVSPFDILKKCIEVSQISKITKK